MISLLWQEQSFWYRHCRLIFDGTATREKQPEESPTPYAAMISKKMGLLDFGKSAEELERLVRGLNPWPSAFTFINGKTLKVWKASVLKTQARESTGNCTCRR